LLQNNRVSPNTIADLFEAIANPNNGLIELRVASQVLKACVAWLLKNNCIFPYTIADLFEAIANPNNSLRVAFQILYKKAYIAWLQNSGVFSIIADLFEAIANPNNSLIKLRVASQVLYKEAYTAWLQNSGRRLPGIGWLMLQLHFSRHYCRPLRGYCQPQQQPYLAARSLPGIGKLVLLGCCKTNHCSC
jgi:hypothetical protein